MSRENIRGCDASEFGVKQARPIRGFTTETLQDSDTHPPYATGKRAALPRDPRRGRRGGMPTFSRSKLGPVFLRGISRNNQQPWFSRPSALTKNLHPPYSLGHDPEPEEA